MPYQPPNQPEAVRNLQTYLRRLSLDDPRLPAVPIDGIFDTVTAEAVRIFQEIYALPITGRVDLETWERILKEYRRALVQSDRTPVLHLFPTIPPNYVLRIGEESITVSFLQLLLRELSLVYETLEAEEISGRYGEVTASNVRQFQKRALLPETGEVDLITWNRILRDYNRYAESA